MATQTGMVIYSGGLVQRIVVTLRSPKAKPQTATEKEAKQQEAQRLMTAGYL